jgi:hypothetical protein
MESLSIRSITPLPHAEIDYAPEDLSRLVEYRSSHHFTISSDNYELKRYVQETIIVKAQSRYM